MPVIHNLLKQRYIYSPARIEQIPDHFAKIKHWVPADEHMEFMERMEECIEEGTAWCTENTFLYYKTDGHVGVGIALFGMDHPLEVLALFMGVFSYRDKTTHALKFKLHPGKQVQEYKSLLTSISINRNNQNEEHPLMIRVDELRKRWSHVCAKAWDVE